jgi:hypothetical protein
LFAFIACCSIWGLPLSGVAKCGNGEPASYDDITMVAFTRQECYPWRHPPDSMACSRYWLMLTKFGAGQADIAEYSQFTLPGKVGTFEMPGHFDELIALLQSHHFFSLNSAPLYESGSSPAVLTVSRCMVVTRLIMWPYGKYVDPATNALFRDIDVFVERSNKQQVSQKPKTFPFGIGFGDFEPQSK